MGKKYLIHKYISIDMNALRAIINVHTIPFPRQGIYINSKMHIKSFHFPVWGKRERGFITLSSMLVREGYGKNSYFAKVSIFLQKNQDDDRGECPS